MNALQIIVNSFRRLDSMFPGYFGATPKHDHKKDFGWPETLSFEDFFYTFNRNGIASAAIEHTIGKTWETHPELVENEDSERTPLEEEVFRHLRKIRFWQALMEADRRSLVGGYAGVIFRFADSKMFNEPVDRVAGLESLVEVIPAWAGQLRVSSFVTDQTSQDYGKPKMFTFNEAQVDESPSVTVKQNRSFEIHPDRVFVWSKDGTVHCPSSLQPGFNDLIDLEKVKGAGGEGFWKNAKSAPILEIDKEAKLDDMARSMNVTIDELVDKMNDQVDDFQRGFDKLLMLQGMQAKQHSVTLPSPEHFWGVPLQSFAASFGIPLKILVGNQTGERASTEDSKSWAQTCNSRRLNSVVPNIESIVDRFKAFGVMSEAEWEVRWADLTESTTEEKLSKAEKMSSINSKSPAELVFLPEEIREVVGYEPLTAEQLAEYEEDEETDVDGNPLLEDDEQDPEDGNE